MAKEWSCVIIKINLCLLIALATTSFSAAQQETPIAIISQETGKVIVDNLGAIYAYNDFEINKYDENGALLYSFQSLENGAISQLDASNPLKLIVYYKESLLAKVLDNTLSEMASFSLQDFGYVAVELIAYSRDDYFWFYDSSSNTLVKWNNTGEVLLQSEPLHLLFQNSVLPTNILLHEGLLYLSDPKEGVFIFDQFGTFKKQLYLKGVENFQIVQNRLIYFNETSLKMYDLQFGGSVEQVAMLDGELLDALYTRNRKVLVFPNRVEIYRN